MTSLKSGSARHLETIAAAIIGAAFVFAVASGAGAQTKLIGAAVVVTTASVVAGAFLNPKLLGIALALAAIAAFDGLPLIPISKQVGFYGCLVFVLGSWLGRRLKARGPASEVPKQLKIWVGVSLLVLIAETFRPALTDPAISLTHSALIAITPIALTLMVPALTSLLRDPAVWRAALTTLVAAVTAFAVIRVAVSPISTSLELLVLHPHLARKVGDVTRVYSWYNDLAAWLMFVALAVALTGSRSLRNRAIFVSFLAFATVMLSLVRVSYIASAVAVLVGAAIWLPRLGVAAWPRVMRLASAVLVGAVIFSFTGVGESTLSTVEQRIGSLAGNSARPADQSAIDLRAQWTKVMLRRLGDDWPVGTGFIHKKDRLLPGVPNGDPRNGDIGGISMYLAIGLIGILVMAALLFGTALACFRAVGKKPELPAPLEVPVMIATSLFCVYLAISGATLGQMYMPTTVGFVSILLALGIAPAANRLSSKSKA